MGIYKMQFVTDIFDWLHHAWERPGNQRRVGLALLWIYIAVLAAVELKRQGLYPVWLPQPPASHFYSIHLAFTLILGMELLSLIFIIPSSLSSSMGKQFEILTLILLRNAFKELTYLPEPVHIGMDNIMCVAHISAAAAGALSVFVCLGLYRRLARRQRFIDSPQMRMRYVLSKKVLALTLFVIFAGMAAQDTWEYFHSGQAQPFFENFYTVLIFADIAMVIIAQRYMPGYHAVFRNSSFVVGTLLMRLALSSPPLMSPLMGLAAALFVLGVAWATNRFSPNLEMTAQDAQE
ncbi:MAG: hypothetical protein Q4F27_01055 [Desulfovibrionaceae bacterium]|nr:hypothetical protein [Desulfovibrionaceae bacterium]